MPPRKRSRFVLKTTLEVLEDLGINLYTNSVAVLAETVANAWDADAAKVSITVKGSAKDRTLTIEDDGIGMDVPDVNNRFLTVGYRRRKVAGGGRTASGRKVFGKKGIGKLSNFSIANVVEVHSVKGGNRLALRMDLADIEKAIATGTYEPLEIPCAADLAQGTRIVLKSLKPKVHASDGYLRRRLARRFSIIGDGFVVSVNGKALTLADREYYDKFQYVWHYDNDDLSKIAPDVEKREKRPASAGVVSFGRRKVPCEVSGWIATVKKRSQISSTDDDNLNRVALVVRGRVAQEDLLKQMSEAGIFSSYVVGELHVDFLDEDNLADSAASNRQGIKEDDPRFIAVKEFFKKELTHIGTAWTAYRNEAGAKLALEIPELNAWFNDLNKPEQKIATGILGKLNTMDVKSDSDRRTLFAQGVLAFEMFRVKHNLEALEGVPVNDIVALGALFGDMSAVEAALYHEVVTQRLGMIRKLESLKDEDALEKLLQQQVFEQLWLLDPSWARATEAPVMEMTMKKLLDGLNAKMSAAIKNARVDIKYREASGRHIIIELKRASRVVSTAELIPQVTKYRDGIKAKLLAVGKPDEPFEIVVLVGKPLSDWTTEEKRQISRTQLAALNTRVMQYDEVIVGALSRYQEYLDRETKANRISRIVASVSTADLTGEKTFVVPGKKTKAKLPPAADDAVTTVTLSRKKTTTKIAGISGRKRSTAKKTAKRR
jgi:hypothetical protein